MSYFVSAFLALATIAGACLVVAAPVEAVQDVVEVVVLNGPNAGTYRTPADETICMHHKEMKFHAVTWRDLDNHPKKLSIANIQVANSDRPGPKHGQVQIVFGDGKTPVEYAIKEAAITMTMKGKGGVLSFEGAVKGVSIKVTGTCSVFEDV
jgi:hypothetical protein